jgi:simple sugar transport system ATP-binding protein
VSKAFGALLVLQDVSIAFEPGTVHAVIGENGAGKSTLLGIAAGRLAPDAGVVRVGGAPLAPHTVREAARRGVGLVEQELAIAGALSVLENVTLGAEPVRGFGRIDWAAARERAERAAGDIGLSLEWSALAGTLGVGDRQRLELVRVLARAPQVLLLDEPSAALPPGEAEALYDVLRRLADGGKTVVVVTHRLEDLRRHVDAVSVLRRGKLLSTRALGGGEREAAITEAGRQAMAAAEEPAGLRAQPPPGEVRLEVRDLMSEPALRGVSFNVRAGEIVGMAGIAGNGQEALVRVLAGLERPRSGAVRVESVAVVHEDRGAEGLVLDASVRENLVLGELAKFSRHGVIDEAAVDRAARARISDLGVQAPDLDAPARSLSGGNQQKIVLARVLPRATPSTTLVLAQPTRGLDVASSRRIHDRIRGIRDQGSAVLIVSADLDELRALCGRILVMARGRIVADLSPESPTERFAEAMLGAPAGGGRS